MRRVYQPRAFADSVVKHFGDQPRCALWGKPGIGKSILTLTHLEVLHNVLGEDRPTLVVAPLRVARDGWAKESAKWEHLKGFDEPWRGAACNRVGAIKPGYYTRMGAAIRCATLRLQARPERQRLLLILTDGKPNDLDVYEGRYGLEDTRHAVQEARVAGLTPFCVTIDEKAHDYLPTLFGEQGYALVHRPQDLVAKLTQAWLRLAR